MVDSFKDMWSLRNRGARDSERHKQRIKKAIKDNLHELIAEENIISSKDGKKIKVPMRFLDMYRFKFGKNKNEQGVGQGEGEPGDVIAKEGGQGQSGAGQDPGEQIYEEEVDVEELIDIMLEDLDLPWLEEKEKAVEIETEEIVFQDIAERGLPANIDKRRTVMENLKRNALKGKMKIGGFELNDLRYKVWEKVVEKHSNAAVFLLMDRSGSMTYEKKYIVKSFFWWMVRFLEKKYNNVELVFIAHDTQAREVEEENFFSISESGGTMVSSAFKLAKQIIEDRYPTSVWNNYVFAFSDGDNWPEDNDRCVESVKEILPLCQAVGYGEVEYSDYFYGLVTSSTYRKSNLATIFEGSSELSNNERFMVVSIEKREDIYQCLKRFLRGVDKGNANE
jgi:sporulation protein YhbH